MAPYVWVLVPLLAISLLFYTISPKVHKHGLHIELDPHAAAASSLLQFPVNPTWTGMAAIKYMFVL